MTVSLVVLDTSIFQLPYLMELLKGDELFLEVLLVEFFEAIVTEYFVVF